MQRFRGDAAEQKEKDRTMARDPGKDILKNPAPTGGTTKKTVDGVLTALKIGNGAVSLLAGLLAAVMILYSGYVLYDSFATEYGAYSSAWDLLKYKPDAASAEPSGGAESLAEINKDYRAWLTIYDTTIDYPVVQGEDDLHYASHDVYGNVSLTGAIYLAAGNKEDFSDSYNVIYGHHMDNGAMFGSLDKYADEKYFRTHRVGTLVAESSVYDVTLFAAVSTDAYESKIYSVGDRAEEVIRFLEGDRNQDAGVGTKILVYDEETAKKATKIVALSTCADVVTNGRLVVFGRMEKRADDEPVITDEPTVTSTVTGTTTATVTPKATVTATATPAPEATATATATATPAAANAGNAPVTPTETEAPVVRITVHYVADGKEVFPTEVFVHRTGDQYYITAPQMAGYEADTELLRGTVTEDLEFTIVYRAKVNTLTIRYRLTDGTEISAPYQQTVKTGETNEINSPVIPGYKASILKVSGTNNGRDEEYTVLYIPEDWVIITEPETPLYAGETQIQIGICEE